MTTYTNHMFPNAMNVENQQEQVDDKLEYKGKKFMFVSYCPKEKIWHVAPKRFLLSKINDKIVGQFISSMWFNKEYLKMEDAYFVVVAIEKNISATKVEKDFNKLKNPFPTVYDIPPYIKIASYYRITFDLMMKFVEKSKGNDSHFVFTIRATNNPWSTLSLKIIRNEENLGMDSVILCHPSFEMPLF